MEPDFEKRTRMSVAESAPMSPWRASRGERKAERMPRETKVWEILLATNPDFPTPEKKMVPRELRRVSVKDNAWDKSRFWKK